MKARRNFPWFLLVVLASVAMYFLIGRDALQMKFFGLGGFRSTSGHAQSGDPASQVHSDNSENGRQIDADAFTKLREHMVKHQLSKRGIDDPHVLNAMGRVPRHEFVPKHLRKQAYDDSPLPIGHSQTISQPLIVAMMTQLARVTPDAKALDIGTGSGYQAAILAELADQVFSIEIVEPLASEAKQRLLTLGYQNIAFRCGDGYRGWPDQAPFDVIVVAAAPDHVPEPLIEQLAPGGHLVIPVGQNMQNLVVIEKDQKGAIHRRTVSPVSFVPMTGEAQE